MSPTVKHVLLVVLLTIALVGCNHSTRTIELGTSRVLIDAPLQLSRGAPGWVVFSPNGKLVAVTGIVGWQVDEPEDVATLHTEIREVASGNILFSRNFDLREADDGALPDGAMIPLLFDRQGSRAFVLAMSSGEARIAKLDIATGRDLGTVAGFDSKALEDLSNVQCSPDFRRLFVQSSPRRDTAWILDCDGSVQATENGEIVWTQDGSGKIWKPADLAGLEEDVRESMLHPERKRGELSIVAVQRHETYLEGEAEISTIWLRHANAELPLRPGHQGDVRPRGPAAAVLASDVDLQSYGFVPGQNAIFLVSNMEVRVVPYEIAPSRHKEDGRP